MTVMAPPIAGVVMNVMIVMSMARLGEVRLWTVPGAQTILRIAIESALVCGIVAGPVTLMRTAVAGRENTLTCRCPRRARYPGIRGEFLASLRSEIRLA